MDIKKLDLVDQFIIHFTYLVDYNISRIANDVNKEYYLKASFIILEEAKWKSNNISRLKNCIKLAQQEARLQSKHFRWYWIAKPKQFYLLPFDHALDVIQQLQDRYIN